MKVEVYCDESYPDLLSSQAKQAKYMAIGGVWLPRQDRMNSRDIIPFMDGIPGRSSSYKTDTTPEMSYDY